MPATLTFAAALAGRTLTLTAQGQRRLTLPIDAGGRHRLTVANSNDARAVVESLEQLPGVGVLPAGGGLLGAMSVTENFALALCYDAAPNDGRDIATELAAALALCGLPPQRMAAIGREQPMHLERSERWTLGFARWLLRPPELLVIDRLFAGLARRQAEALISIEAVFHQRHPFRPVFFVDLDSHDLPELPDCLTVTDLAESPCPSRSTPAS